VAEAFAQGELDRDVVVVVRFQGPRANGMPELHKLTPTLQVLQDRGQRVALLTDGRMSGASGSVLAAIHVVPEAAADGAIGRLEDGDVVTVDAEAGLLNCAIDLESLNGREPRPLDLSQNQAGIGRELFGAMRAGASDAEAGASILFSEG
jgi:phosphogluconate dehydratase